MLTPATERLQIQYKNNIWKFLTTNIITSSGSSARWFLACYKKKKIVYTKNNKFK